MGNRLFYCVVAVVLASSACNTASNRPLFPDFGTTDVGEPDVPYTTPDTGPDVGPDISGPTVDCAWVEPSQPDDGSLLYVHGSPDLRARCEHPDGMQGVQFFVDGELFEQVDTPTQGHRYDTWFDTIALPDGDHVFRVLGFASTGEQGEATLDVRVDNTPPTVTVSAPNANSHQLESLTLGFHYEDAEGLSDVRFELFDPADPLHILHMEAPPQSPEGEPAPPWLSGDVSRTVDISAVLTDDYDVTISATDLAGNTRNATVPIHIVTTPRFRAAIPRDAISGTYIEDIGLGDVDGDEILDLILLTSRSVHALSGLGDGRFGEPQELWDEDGDLLHTADLDGDGVSELLIARRGDEGPEVLVLQKRDDVWSIEEQHPLPQLASALTLGLINPDHVPDLVLGSHNQEDSVMVLLAKDPTVGLGFFLEDVHTAGGIERVEDLDVADLDGDGNGDVVAGQQVSRFTVFPGYGDGSFNVPRNTVIGTTPSNPKILSVAVGDMLEDGVPDVAAVADDGRILVFAGEPGDADPFQFGDEEKILDRYPHYHSVEILAADMSGDGHLDLLTVNQQVKTLSVWLGDGRGAFEFAHLFNVGVKPIHAQLGDLDGDGLLDVVLLNEAVGTYTVLMNRGGGSLAGAPELLVSGNRGKTPFDLVVGDFFSATTRPDIIVLGANHIADSDVYGDKLRAFRNDGHFPRMPYLPAEADYYGTGKDARAADIDGDGADDLLFTTDASITNDEQTNLFLRMGPFAASLDGRLLVDHELDIQAGNRNQTLALCDINGDIEGRPDLVFAAREPPIVDPPPPQLYLYDVDFDREDIVMLRAAKDLTGAPVDLQCGLINEDQANDFLTVNTQQLDLNYFKGSWTEAGTYGERESLGVGDDPRRLAIADVNGDGNLDAVVSVDGALAVLFGTGSDADQTFASSLFLDPLGRDPHGVAVRDFNFDGHPDLAVADKRDSTLSVFVNSGGGDFRLPPIDFHTSLTPTEVVSADFNGDGCDDLAVLTSKGHTVTLLLSEGPRCSVTP